MHIVADLFASGLTTLVLVMNGVLFLMVIAAIALVFFIVRVVSRRSHVKDQISGGAAKRAKDRPGRRSSAGQADLFDRWLSAQNLTRSELSPETLLQFQQRFQNEQNL